MLSRHNQVNEIASSERVDARTVCDHGVREVVMVCTNSLQTGRTEQSLIAVSSGCSVTNESARNLFGYTMKYRRLYHVKLANYLATIRLGKLVATQSPTTRIGVPRQYSNAFYSHIK